MNTLFRTILCSIDASKHFETRLLVVADPHVDTAAIQQLHHLLDVGLAVVVGEEHCGFEQIGRAHV